MASRSSTSRVGDAVPKRLGVAPEGDEAFFAHPRQVLREGGLREFHLVGELADRGFSTFHQPAQDQETAVVGDGAQEFRNLSSFGLEVT